MSSVLFIDRSGLSYYGGNVHSVLTFPFDPSVVNDLEVLDAEALTRGVGAWMKSAKADPSDLIFLLSPSCYFQKMIPADTPEDKLHALKQDFISKVPFNDTIIHECPIEGGNLLIVINQTLIHRLRDIFDSLHFPLATIVTASELYGNKQMSAFTTEIAQDAISRAPGIKLDSSTTEDRTAKQEMIDEAPPPPEANNNRLYIMVASFVILLVFLGAFYYLMRVVPTQKAKAARDAALSAPPQPPTDIPVPTVVEATSAVVTVKDREALAIRILNGSGIPGQADTIGAQLKAKGYNAIETGNAPSITASNTIIVFKPTVPSAIRKEISEAVQSVNEDMKETENKDIDVDVLITTSKPAATTSSQ